MYGSPKQAYYGHFSICEVTITCLFETFTQFKKNLSNYLKDLDNLKLPTKCDDNPA